MENLPVIAQKAPYKLDLTAGKYHWCTCGLSQKQPFCDASHKGSGMKSLAFELTEDQTVYLCGCKNTKNPPYCDGTHGQL